MTDECEVSSEERLLAQIFGRGTVGEGLRPKGTPESTSAIPLSQEEVEEILGPLDEYEREVIRLRFGLDRRKPRTYYEIGIALGISMNSASEIVKEALRRLIRPSAQH